MSYEDHEDDPRIRRDLTKKIRRDVVSAIRRNLDLTEDGLTAVKMLMATTDDCFAALTVLLNKVPPFRHYGENEMYLVTALLLAMRAQEEPRMSRQEIKHLLELLVDKFDQAMVNGD